MKYYRKRFSKRFPKRYGGRKTYKRKISKARSNNSAGTILKLKATYTMSSNFSGAFTTTLQPTAVSAWTDWPSIQNLYDSFEVLALKKELRPINVGDESIGAGANRRGNVVSVIDQDGTGMPATIAAAAEYDSFKWYAARSHMKRYLYIPKKLRPKLNDIATGFNTTVNEDCKISFIGDGFTPSVDQYFVVDTAYVRVSGRR